MSSQNLISIYLNFVNYDNLVLFYDVIGNYDIMDNTYYELK